MDEQVQAESRPWYVDTIDFVARAAATNRFMSPQLSNNTMYYVDQNGNTVPMGQPTMKGAAPAGVALLNSPVVLLAGLALVGVLLYKLVK